MDWKRTSSRERRTAVSGWRSQACGKQGIGSGSLGGVVEAGMPAAGGK